MKNLLTFSILVMLCGCPAPPPPPPAPAQPVVPDMTTPERMARHSDIASFGTMSVTVNLPPGDKVLILTKNVVLPAHIQINANDNSCAILGSAVDVAKVYKQMFNVGPETGLGR